MSQLNRETVVWEHPSGAVAHPIEYSQHEPHPSDDDLPPVYANDPDELQPVTFRGWFPRGTPVEDMVDLGANNRVSCKIAGRRVTTVKWVISE
jgi:hypothetical protein